MPRNKFRSLIKEEEELILLCQKGNDLSWETLVKKYLARASYLAIKVLPEYSGAYQQCDVEECMLVSIMNAVFTYKSGIRGFYQYLMVIYRNELLKMLHENKSFYRSAVISLSDSVPGTEDTLTFEDVIPDKKEDPISFCNTLLATESFKGATDGLDDVTKQVVMLRLQGNGYKTIAEMLGMSYKSARFRYMKYKELMDRFLDEIKDK